MLDFLDNPRQALWNMGSGLAEGDFSKAAPGLLGAALAGGLGMTGIGLPLAALAGSAVGGLGQNLFGSSAPSRDDMAKTFGFDPETTGGQIGSFALDMATDPLSLAGVGIGSRLGRQAGSSIGRGLEQAAIQRGPRYSTTLDDLLRTFPEKVGTGSDDMASMAAGTLEELRGSKPLSAMLQEIPEGSRYLGSGAEGIAFKTPTNDVARFGMTTDQMGRPITDVLLQPTRGAQIDSGLTSGYSPRPTDVGSGSSWTSVKTSGQSPVMLRTERLPMAENVGNARAIMAASGDKLPNRPLAQQWDEWTRSLADEQAGKRLDAFDLAPANLGTHGGKPVIIDPGSLAPMPGYEGGFNPLVDASAGNGKITNALLSLLGSDKSMQKALAQGRNSVNYQQPFQSVGSLLGGSAGLAFNGGL